MTGEEVADIVRRVVREELDRDAKRRPRRRVRVEPVPSEKRAAIRETVMRKMARGGER